MSETEKSGGNAKVKINGVKIKSLREARGKSQEGVKKELRNRHGLKINERTIRRIESGEQRSATLVVVNAVAQVLNVEVSEITFVEDEIPNTVGNLVKSAGHLADFEMLNESDDDPDGYIEINVRLRVRKSSLTKKELASVNVVKEGLRRREGSLKFLRLGIEARSADLLEISLLLSRQRNCQSEDPELDCSKTLQEQLNNGESLLSGLNSVIDRLELGTVEENGERVEESSTSSSSRLELSRLGKSVDLSDANTCLSSMRELARTVAGHWHDEEISQSLTLYKNLGRRRAQLLLLDRITWNHWPEALRKQVTDDVAVRLKGSFQFVEHRGFERAGQSHCIAIFLHSRTGISFHLIPGEKNIGALLVARTPVSREQWLQGLGEEVDEIEELEQAQTSCTFEEVKSWFDSVGDGLRLPTSKEWEYLCRAGSADSYYWGAQFSEDHCWFSDNSDGRAMPVNRHWLENQFNSFGLVDTLGNVEELCLDDDQWLCKGGSYLSRPTQISADQDHSFRKAKRPFIGFRPVVSLCDIDLVDVE